MILQSLTISGFKSFAKKSDLEFSSPITAIVGPNGSGKSNVAESFRFVLGEQSVKSMRGKRGEDLIWGGSEFVSRGNRASVSVVFNNTQRNFNLDFDEVTIERIVHRDGQNEYRINGTQVRLKDVQELLAAAHIGASGHHIISQGEADRILSANAKERREMLEDALGLRVYQFKKAEAERKLEKTKANIESVQSLRREHAPHLTYLKKQVDRIEKSIALQNELKVLYAEYLKREDIYLSHHSTLLQNQQTEPAQELEQINSTLHALKQQLRDQGEEKKDKSDLIVAETALATARQHRQSALRQLSQLEGQVHYVRSRIANLSRQPHEKKEVIAISEVKALFSQIEKDISTAVTKDDVIFLRRTLQNISQIISLFVSKIAPMVSVSTEDEERELQSLESQAVTLKAAFEVAQEKEQEAERHYQQCQKMFETTTSETFAIEKQIFELVNAQREVERTLERIQQEQRTLERDREEFKRELREAVALVRSAASQYFTYEIIEHGVPVTIDTIVAENRLVQFERRRHLEKLKIRLEELGIGATEEVVKEYTAAKERDAFLEKEIDDLQVSVATLEGLINDLSGQLRERFVAGIETINTEFHRFFVLMFGGGNARLSQSAVKQKSQDEDEDNVISVEDGVDIEVSLPNKRVKGLDMLSGGERALTSIALLFAMSQVNPPPFIILDETDAALDEANSRRYGDMIQALAQKSQLILITHNRETMSRAGVLYGVTMGNDGVSKLLSVKFAEAAAIAK
jgi:chromosome segregation ATPase